MRPENEQPASWRVFMPPRLNELLAALGISGSRETYDRVLREAGGSLALQPSRNPATHKLDTSRATHADVQNWLHDRLGGFDDTIDVAWVASQIGASLPAHVFVNHIDDLWYPALDDVVVVARGAAFSAVILLDHEERLEFRNV